MDEIKVAEEKKLTLPWQFSTAGMVVGFFFGFIPLLIALMGNYQMKKGYNVDELKKAYNIIFIITIILIAFFIVLYIIIIAAAIANSSPSSYYY